MPEPHFDGLREYADDAIRQPDFADVRRRAGRVRRRRAIGSTAAAAAAVLAVAGVGYAATAGPHLADPGPSTSADQDAGWPRLTEVVATGPNDLYAMLDPCHDCAPALYASADAGTTWQRRAVPPPPAKLASGSPRVSGIVALGENVLAWRDGPAEDRQNLWTTVDGGRTWRWAVIDKNPVAAMPPGTRPVDCDLIGQPAPCRVYAVNPDTGWFAPLAGQPSGITVEAGWSDRTDAPLGADLWVPGLDPATRKPALASSSDGGRTWRTHVFTGGVPAAAGHGLIATTYLPTVAAGRDGTAYALTYRKDQKLDPYRTTDGGATWRPVPGGTPGWVPDAGFVTTDGSHVVKTGATFAASHGGGKYQPVTLSGYPADLRRQTQITWQPAAGRYLAFSLSDLYLSEDGWTWRPVDLP